MAKTLRLGIEVLLIKFIGFNLQRNLLAGDTTFSNSLYLLRVIGQQLNGGKA